MIFHIRRHLPDSSLSDSLSAWSEYPSHQNSPSEK